MEAAGGRDVSDAERGRQWACEVERRASRPNRTHTGRSRSLVKSSHSGDVPRALPRRLAEIFFQETRVPLNRAQAGLVTRNAGCVAVVVVMASTGRGRVGVAPRPADQRAAGPSRQHHHDE